MFDETNLAAIAPVCDHAPTVDGGVAPSAPAQPEHSDLEFPAWVWRTMFACYGLFFLGLTLATGRDTEALFIISICAAYAVMYFSSSAVLVRLKSEGHVSAFSQGRGPLQTLTGPMSIGAVAGQVLTIPICFALFGLAVAVIRVAVDG